MTTFFIILGAFVALFIVYLVADGLGFRPSDNPNDPRSEDEKYNGGGV